MVNFLRFPWERDSKTLKIIEKLELEHGGLAPLEYIIMEMVTYEGFNREDAILKLRELRVKGKIKEVRYGWFKVVGIF